MPRVAADYRELTHRLETEHLLLNVALVTADLLLLLRQAPVVTPRCLCPHCPWASNATLPVCTAHGPTSPKRRVSVTHRVSPGGCDHGLGSRAPHTGRAARGSSCGPRSLGSPDEKPEATSRLVRAVVPCLWRRRELSWTTHGKKHRRQHPGPLTVQPPSEKKRILLPLLRRRRCFSGESWQEGRMGKRALLTPPASRPAAVSGPPGTVRIRKADDVADQGVSLPAAGQATEKLRPACWYTINGRNFPASARQFTELTGAPPLSRSTQTMLS
ncbi:PREDICTED: uncharacterized protein LOC109389723 [Hipposideros armiger]|uniref:Uncharacterized protein LOC109389723 n=1 Tax=Hipposideros armiger TaxID=186990 RepID=A0A8B7SEM6_HIPAR|nr:PREDICTED: uncharacterized protein LOC109389723 [Hipposideros armiger]